MLQSLPTYNEVSLRSVATRFNIKFDPRNPLDLMTLNAIAIQLVLKHRAEEITLAVKLLKEKFAGMGKAHHHSHAPAPLPPLHTKQRETGEDIASLEKMLADYLDLYATYTVLLATIEAQSVGLRQAHQALALNTVAAKTTVRQAVTSALQPQSGTTQKQIDVIAGHHAHKQQQGLQQHVITEHLFNAAHQVAMKPEHRAISVEKLIEILIKQCRTQHGYQISPSFFTNTVAHNPFVSAHPGLQLQHTIGHTFFGYHRSTAQVVRLGEELRQSMQQAQAMHVQLQSTGATLSNVPAPRPAPQTMPVIPAASEVRDKADVIEFAFNRTMTPTLKA